MRRLLSRLSLTLVLLLAGAAFAQECTYEAEPNDEPFQANPLERAGAASAHAYCMTGELSSGSDQDWFLWDVGEEDAETWWEVEFESVRGQKTLFAIYQMTFLDDGVSVTAADQLFGASSSDGRLTTAGPFLITPGRYHVGLTASGGSGNYVALLRGGDSLGRGSSAFQPTRPQTRPFTVHGLVDGGAAQPFVIDEAAAEQVWEVSLQASIGARPTLRLVGPSGVVGEARADTSGRARLTSLGLEAGEYELRIEGEGGIVSASLTSLGRRTAGRELEPNNSWDSANIFPIGTSIKGGLDGDRDVFRTEVDEAAGDGAWDLVVEATGEVTVTLLEGDGPELQSRRGVGGVMSGLHLAPGSYQVRVDGRSGADYTLTWRAASDAGAGMEREPNDTRHAATPLGPDGQVRGELTTSDVDFYRYEVTGGAQLFRVQAVGEQIRSLAVIGRDGRTVVEAPGGSRVRLDDVLLLPGEHYVRVQGGEGAYALRVMSLGPAPDGSTAVDAPGASDELRSAAAAPPEPEVDVAAAAEIPEPAGPPPPAGHLEWEPNDDRSRAHRLRPGEVHVGRLHSPRDRDYYRFHLSDDQYVRIELVPPEGDGAFRLNLNETWHQPPELERGATGVVERWLLAGDHSVFVAGGNDVTAGYYQLRLTFLGQLDLPPVVKPNDTPHTAGLLPFELAWRSRVGSGDGNDLFRLPAFDEETAFTLTAEWEGGRLTAALLTEAGSVNLRESDGRFEGVLPAGEEALLRLSGTAEYEARIEFEAEPDRSQLQAPRGDGLVVELAEQRTELAAFWPEPQVVKTEVTVRNTGDAQERVRLDAAVTEPSAVVTVPPEFELAPGESAQLTVEVRLPPDLRDDVPLHLSVAAASERSRAVAGLAAVPLCEALPVSPTLEALRPTYLLGRFDLLWDAFGARVMEGAPTIDPDRLLLDGRTTPSAGGRLTMEHAPTFELGGGRPARLVGTLLHPMARGAVEEQLKGFRIETSLDGANFTPVFEGELKAARVEQAFAFDEPVEARFARLVLLSTHGGGRTAQLGEWKLLAEAGSGLGRLDLAAPAFGGHVVWSNRLLGNAGQAILQADAHVSALDMRSDGSDFVFVVGFHHDRAAMITELVWRDSPRFGGAADHTLYDSVTVEVSLTSPLGPWQPLAEWELEKGADGVATLELEEPTWARYLRFTAPTVEGVRYHWPPDLIQVFEREPGDGYLSALGEWGHYSRTGTYEALNPSPAAYPVDEGARNGTRESATPLGSGDVAQGSVLVGEREAWFRLVVPEGENQLTVRLSGDPSIAYDYQLEAADGSRVPYVVRSDGESEVLELYAEPGDYYLHLEEPRRSVVFAWDTSGSVRSYMDITYSSLASFALDLDGDKEYAQLLAFDDPLPKWLLPFWSGEPERVQRAITEFDRDAHSSNSETALLVATEALAQREGTRAIMLITDAETFSYDMTPELWEAMEGARPQIFTFEVSSGGNARPQDLMQNWAAVNGGFYDFTTGIGSFDAGFARASCILRRPKAYRVEVTTDSVPPPGPGLIEVKRAAGAAEGAVEVIFDASGSMGQNLPSGEQRIVAAKRVLESLIGEVLPEGAPFALRAFGHVSPNSCEMELEVPLGPLDREGALRAVRGIEPKLLSQTPLAAALEAVATDMPASGAGRTVILITDGVESCGGDPAAAVAALRAQGPIDLAIVSLGLGSDDLAVFEALAEQVGASYVDVGSFEELERTVTAALHPAFEVVGPDGEVVARGHVDGGAVEVPMGVYTVRVRGATVQEFREVRVPGDGRVALAVGARR